MAEVEKNVTNFQIGIGPISASAKNAQKAEVWAEGTDEQVAELGGTHSAKGWAETVDTSNFMPKSGGTFTGDITMANNKKINFQHFKIEENNVGNPIIGDGNGNGLVISKNGTGAALFANNGSSYTDLIKRTDVKSTYSSTGLDPVNGTAVTSAISGKQDALPSGTTGQYLQKTSDGVQWSPVSGTLPTQTGQSGKFLTTDGTDASWSDKPLANKAIGTNSLTIFGVPTSSNYSINIGPATSVEFSSNFSTVVGYNCSSTAMAATAIGYRAGVEGKNSIQIGPGLNTNASTLSIGLDDSHNYQLLASDGTIPNDRLNIMTGADGTNAGTKGAVPAPTATDNTKYLKGDGTWSAVDSLPSQTGNSGKFLTTDGSSASWEEVSVPENTWTSDNLKAGSNISITEIQKPAIDANTLALWHLNGDKTETIGTLTSSFNISGDTYVTSPTPFSGTKMFPLSLPGDRSLFTVQNTGIGTGDFTVDFWEYTSSFPSYGKTFIFIGNTYTGNLVLRKEDKSDVYWIGAASNYTTATSKQLITGRTVHIAVERYNQYLNYYVDGELIGTSSYTYTTSFSDLEVKTSLADSYISEIRVSNVARYQGQNFTPFTQPYAAAGGITEYSINANFNTISGYDASKTQVLKNINGTLTWVDEV